MALNRKKKNRLTAAILFSAIILLVAGYFVIPAIIKANQPVEDEPEVTQPALSSFISDELSSVEIASDDFNGTIVRTYETSTDSEGETTTTAIYSLKENPDFPLDSKKAASLFTYAVLAAAECITEEGELSEYGLDTPGLTLTLTNLSGETETIAIGNVVGMSGKGGYYANVNGSKSVYLTQSSMYTNVYHDEAGWIALAAPSIDTATISSISYTDGNGTKLLSKGAAFSTALYGAAYSNWTATLVSGRNVILDDETVATHLADSYGSISVSSAVDYKAENYSEYGLDNPQATVVIVTEETDNETGEIIGEATYRLFLGARYSEDFYYVAFEGDSRTYLVSATRVDDLFILDTAGLVYNKFCSIDLSTVDSMTVTAGDISNTYSFTLGLVEKDEDGDGETTTETTVTAVVRNGETVENTDGFLEFYAALLALDSDTYISENPEEAGTALLELKFIRNDENLTELLISFEEYNTNYALVRVNGEALFTYALKNLEELINIIP